MNAKAMKGECLLRELELATLNERMDQVERIHNMMLNVIVHTQHLTKLKDISETLVSLKDDLVAPATGRKQISLSAFFWTVGLLGVFFIILLLERSTKNFKLSSDGLTIMESDSAYRENGVVQREKDIARREKSLRGGSEIIDKLEAIP